VSVTESDLARLIAEQALRRRVQQDPVLFAQQFAKQQAAVELAKQQTLARASAGIDIPAENREIAKDFLRGRSVSDFTVGADLVGLMSQFNAKAPAFLREPEVTMSGQPMRGLVGLEEDSIAGMAGESLSLQKVISRIPNLVTTSFASMASRFARSRTPDRIPLRETEIISTRRPTAVKATESPDSEYLRIDLETARRDPRSFEHNVGVVTGYPNYRPRQGVTSPNGRAEAFIEDIEGNLLFLHDAVDPAIRTRSSKWYDGTSVIVDRFGEAYPGLSRRQYSGVIAALSPQKDWFMNASLAERVIQTKHMFGAHMFDDAMAEVASRIGLNNSAKGKIKNIIGKRLDEISDPVEQAWFIRLFDEAHNPRSYSVISPEGEFMHLNQTLDGSPASIAWGGSGSIAKGVSIIDDGSIANISRRLGNMHKVRSFNNNIIDPNNPMGDVTIDTHAVAAALLRPLSGNTAEVGHAFGGLGAANNSVLGVNGTYPLYAEAYRRAAARRGLLPRQLQSITWEASRGLFTPVMKRDKQYVAEIDRIWGLYRNKRISIDEARRSVHDVSGGIDNPSWHIPGAGLHAGPQHAAGPGNLPVAGAPRQGQGFDIGRGNGVAADVPQVGRPGLRATAIQDLRSNVDGHVTGGQPPTFRRTVGGNSQRNLSEYNLPTDRAERLNRIGTSTPTVREMTGLTGARDFHRAITQGKASNEFGAQVSIHPIEKYRNMRLFMTPDGNAGFAIDGDTLVSLFSNSKSPYKNISTELVLLGIEQGGRKLDNYDTFLSGIYKRLGFEEVSRSPWDEARKPADWDKTVFRDFNNGEPDYLFMEYKPQGGLIDRLVDSGKLDVPNQIPAQIADDVDLSRFDDTLKATVQ